MQKGVGGRSRVLFGSAGGNMAVMATTAAKARYRAPLIWSSEPGSSVETEDGGQIPEVRVISGGS